MNLTKQFHVNNTVTTDNVTEKYSPVSTSIVLAPFYNKGWTVKKHIQPRPDKEGNRYGKELITLVHPDFKYSNGDHLTVECLNSNNGKSALMLMGGYGRIVCSNGLILGDIEGGRFVHRGESIYEKIDKQYDRIVAKLEDMREGITLLKETTYDNEVLTKVITNIYKEVFNKDTKKFRAQVTVKGADLRRVLKIYRDEDFGDDLFTAMNVVQENIIRKGRMQTTVTTYNKETKEVVTEVKGKNACEGKITAMHLNKIITAAFLKEVA